MKLINILFFYLFACLTVFLHIEKATAEINPEAEKYITKKLNQKVPYQINFLNSTFTIDNVNVYPPGKLSEIFGSFLIENNLLKNKVVADIGCACFPLGIVAAKNGAKIVIGTDISNDAIKCAKNNVALNKIKNAHLFIGEGLTPLLPTFEGKVDIIVSGMPWDSITYKEFASIAKDRQTFSRSFYDVDDKLINDLFSNGFKLLNPKGKIFITSSMRTLERIKKACSKYNLSYKIAKEANIHNDGNTHYILQIYRL